MINSLRINKLLGIAIALMTIFTLSAQDENPDGFYSHTLTEINPKHSFTFEVGLPVIVANKFNRTYMGGLIYASPYYQYSFANHLSLGAGVFYNYMGINAVATSENIRGRNNIMGGYFKMSHEKFHNSRFATDAGVKVGYAQSLYQSNKLKEAGITSTEGGFYIEPNIGLILTVSEKSSFRFFVAYNILGIPFDNTKIGMESDGGMSGKDFRKIQQHLTFGFGYTFYAKTR